MNDCNENVWRIKGKESQIKKCINLDLRSEGLRFNFQCWSCVQVLGSLTFHTVIVHSTVMGTLCTDPRFDQCL